MSKGFRQAQIQKLIRSAAIHTQEELGAALAPLGVEATQVTLSRDIRELGIVKTADGYQERAAIEPAGRARDNLSRVLQEFLHDVQVAQNLVVLKTNPGGAGAVALALDSEHWSEIVGTVAGDDTIFVAAESAAKARKLRRKLLELR